MGGFGIGTTEFTMMGLLKEVEQGLNISTPEAGHLISAYALGVVIGAPLLAAVGAKLPRKYLALGLMLFFSIANLTSFLAPDYGSMLVSRFAAGLPHGAFFGVAAVIAASLVAPTKRGLGHFDGHGRADRLQRHRRSLRHVAGPERTAGGCCSCWWA